MSRSRTWGYEQADCIGNNALGLFIDDLEYLIAHFTQAPNLHTEARIFQAQAAADTLVQHYATHARRTQAFQDQKVTIRAIDTGKSGVQLLPVFSAGLKKSLETLLAQSNATPIH